MHLSMTRLTLGVLGLVAVVVASSAAAGPVRRSASGTVALTIAAARWNDAQRTLEVEGHGTPGLLVWLSDTVSGSRIGASRVGRSGSWRLVKRLSTGPCGVTASDGRSTASSDVVGAAPCDAEPTLVSLAVGGPAEVGEGSVAALTATAVRSDGATLDVTTQASWSVQPALATVANGVLTAGEVDGDQTVTVAAAYATGNGTLSSSHRITIRDHADPPPALVNLEISGPGEVEEGGSIRLSATASLTDGSTVDVTGAARWSVAPALATITSGLLVAGEVDADRTVTVTATTTDASSEISTTREVTIRDRTTPGPVQGSHAGRFATYEGTRTCLSCHLTEARTAHASVHYQWRGDASEAQGLDSQLAGKLGGINDFCIYPDINWIGKLTNLDGALVDGGCSKCHAGLGLKPDAEPTQEQLENVDCLVCHSASYRRTVADVGGSLRWVPDIAAMGVSALQAAVDISLPDSARCLNCHTKAGGGDNFKRGDIEEAHRAATASFDVHLAPRSAGGAGLQCLDCHVGSGHKVAGRGVDLRPRELAAAVACETCHTSRPHDSSDLNRHTARVGCTTCHVPDFAQVAATDMRRDWSAPGDVNPASRLFEPHMLMASHVRPEYRFFNGRSEFYQFGSRSVPQADGRVLMAGPLGDVSDAGAKIVPLKHHTGRQPIDPVSGRLLPLKIGIFFQTGNTDEAIRKGAAAVGWDLPSGYAFAETERFMGIFHEVRPEEQALGCRDCHGGSRLDFAALGYTPNATRNGRPLCTSCHEDESDEDAARDFFKLHDKHVRDKRIDCANCHSFSSAN